MGEEEWMCNKREKMREGTWEMRSVDRLRVDYHRRMVNDRRSKEERRTAARRSVCRLDLYLCSSAQLLSILDKRDGERGHHDKI